MKICIDGEEREVLTRHCPHCGKFLNRIKSAIESIDYGHINHDPEEIDPQQLDIQFSITEWKEDGHDNFFCLYCYETITTDLDEAKEFIQLPETVEE